MNSIVSKWLWLGLLLISLPSCDPKPGLVHRDIPSDGICIQASEMFGQTKPGPCRPGIAECTTGPELRVAYNKRGVARLKGECASTFRHTKAGGSP